MLLNSFNQTQDSIRLMSEVTTDEERKKPELRRLVATHLAALVATLRRLTEYNEFLLDCLLSLDSITVFRAIGSPVPHPPTPDYSVSSSSLTSLEERNSSPS